MSVDVEFLDIKPQAKKRKIFEWEDGLVPIARVAKDFYWASKRMGYLDYPELYYRGVLYTIINANPANSEAYVLWVMKQGSNDVVRILVKAGATLTKKGKTLFFEEDRSKYTAEEFWKKFSGKSTDFPRRLYFMGAGYHVRSMTWLSNEKSLLLVLEGSGIEIMIEVNDKYDSYIQNDFKHWTIRNGINIPHEKVSE